MSRTWGTGMSRNERELCPGTRDLRAFSPLCFGSECRIAVPSRIGDAVLQDREKPERAHFRSIGMCNTPPPLASFICRKAPLATLVLSKHDAARADRDGTNASS